jgi:hypothetical protein
MDYVELKMDNLLFLDDLLGVLVNSHRHFQRQNCWGEERELYRAQQTIGNLTSLFLPGRGSKFQDEVRTVTSIFEFAEIECVQQY